MTFADRLYLGFRAEYHVIGEFFALGYECFKLPGDFGFDLMVTNQKEVTLGPPVSGRTVEPPFALQVKSALATIVPSRTSGSRPIARCRFILRSDDFNKVTSDRSGHYVFVAVLPPPNGEVQNRSVTWWFSGQHIQGMKERGYLWPTSIDGAGVHELRAQIRFLPTQTRDALIKPLLDKNWLTPEGRAQLERDLPVTLPTAWNASEYIALARKARDGTNDDAWRMVPEHFVGVSQMGFDHRLGSLD
jgi:hypothetical protein